MADSYEAARRPLVQYLDQHQFQVEEAANGREVVEVLQKVRPALIVAERTLPRLLAWQVAARHANSPASRPVAAILTSTGSEPDAPADLPLGPTAALMKPFRLEEMLTEVRRLLQQEHPPQMICVRCGREIRPGPLPASHALCPECQARRRDEEP